MNVDKLIHKYFKGNQLSPTIEVFDNDTIYNTYTDIVKLLNGHPDIELTMLQGLSYCFYEVLDNVLTHSEKNLWHGFDEIFTRREQNTDFGCRRWYRCKSFIKYQP